MGETPRAKLFMHGRSQAVRLPKEFRMPGTEVEVFRQGEDVVLRPMKRKVIDWPELWAKLDALGPDLDPPIGRDEGLLPPRDIEID
jgi:antitoxin VapB